MTTQIRNAVFETNSSSSHSVTVDPAELADHGLSKEVLRAGVIRGTLENGAYGWGWQRFYDPGSKIAYLMLQLVGGTIPAAVEGLETHEDHVAAFKDASDDVGFLIARIEEVTGCRFELVRSSASLDYGYSIDHESVGVGRDLLDDDEALLKFIFGKNSYVETSNDNDSPPETITTDRGDEAYYDSIYTSAAPDGEAFEFTDVYCDRMYRGIRFACRGEVIETGAAGWEDRKAFNELLLAEDMTMTGFTIHIDERSPGVTGRNSDKYLRNLLVAHHERLFREAESLRVARGFEVALEHKEYDSEERHRPDIYEYERNADYTTMAVASSETVSRLADVVKDIVARKATAENEVKP